MILVDTSIWIDHLRVADAILDGLLKEGRVLAHPFVIGEIALGNLRQRDLVLRSMLGLPRAEIVREQEMRGFIEREGLAGLGIGYVDAHLLAAVRLTRDASLWTRDKRLASVAERLSVAAHIRH